MGFLDHLADVCNETDISDMTKKKRKPMQVYIYIYFMARRRN